VHADCVACWYSDCYPHSILFCAHALFYCCIWLFISYIVLLLHCGVYVIQSISADYRVLLEGPGIALRGLFLISPQGVLEQITVNNIPVGRSVVSISVIIASVYYIIPHSNGISNVDVVIQLLCKVVYTLQLRLCNSTVHCVIMCSTKLLHCKISFSFCPTAQLANSLHEHSVTVL
jgi:hypothetical protein